MPPGLPSPPCASPACRRSILRCDAPPVTGLAGTPAAPVVQIRLAGATEMVSCRLVVAADGASSPVRAHAALRHRRRRTAVLTGYLVGRDALPLSASGHVFTAAGGPVLAYGIGNDRARVLVDRPLWHGGAGRAEARAATAALTPRLRAEVEAAIAAGTGRRFVSTDVTVAGVAQGRVVLVGDAAGSCHPISASGMTMGIDDAARLARALRCRGGEVAPALALYASERRSHQRARVLLAAMLHDVLGGAGPEMNLLRAGLHRYWSGSARARTASMALLAMSDVRIRSILIEFLRVMVSGLSASCGEPMAMLRQAGLMARLSRPMMRNVVGAMRVQ